TRPSLARRGTLQSPSPHGWGGVTPHRRRGGARLALPMLALVPSEQARVLADAYRDEWASLGRAAADLPPLGISRQIVLAETNEKALEIAARAFAPFSENISYLWKKFNVPMPPRVADGTFGA